MTDTEPAARTWREAVDVLTRLAHHREGGVPVDLAGALAGVLAAVAANLGGTERLTAGRPGSWESGLVLQLVAGTVGHDDEDLSRHRTEPVVVPLNVLALPWAVDGFPSLDDALDRLDDPDDLATVEAVTTSYADRYAAYAEAFTAAVERAAADLPGLAVPVQVIAMHDPRHETDGGPDVRNPISDDRPDALAANLWRAAFAATPFPPDPQLEDQR